MAPLMPPYLQEVRVHVVDMALWTQAGIGQWASRKKQNRVSAKCGSPFSAITSSGMDRFGFASRLDV